MTKAKHTARIAFRVTPQESKTIHQIAAYYGLSLTDLLTQALTIALANKPPRDSWRSLLSASLTTSRTFHPWKS